MRESTVENYLTEKVKALGGDVRKVKWLGRRHAPDRLVMLPEVPNRGPAGNTPSERFLVELKATGKKPTAGQLREHARLRKFGWRVEVIDSIEGIDEML